MINGMRSMRLNGIKYGDELFMLETPNEKISNLTVKFMKQNFPEVEENTFMQEAMDKFIVSFNNAYEKALDKFVKQVAEDEGLSYKCAKYYAEKTFKFEIELVVPKNPRTHELRDNPELVLVPRFKTPEELIYEMDNVTSYKSPLEIECEKELLRSSAGKVKEKVKGVFNVP